MLRSLEHLYLPGAMTLWCATLFGLAAMWGYSLVLRGDRAALGFARRAYGFFTSSIVLASAVLVVCLARRDFRIEYVYQYSGLDLAGHFQIAAFWAGQKGSFLIWLLWASLLGLFVRRSAGEDEAPVMGFYLVSLFGLLFILVRESPFVMLRETPVDGAGLNPLLQDDWMVIHPPVMFVGYAAAAIPACFALAAMWRGDTSRWAAKAFPWALFGFLVLGTAILMGGYWAYRTLGWGGYWGWDPVENASLIPWIFGTVLIHGLYLERAKGRYRRANLIIACLVYVSVLYGTFLTRSGVLADFSVHSFVELGILSRWLFAYLAFFLVASIYLLATRLPKIDTGVNDDPFLSRGAFLVLMSIVVTVCGLLVTFGTSAPLLTKYFAERPAQVGPSFYNRVNLPLALLIAFLMALVPFLTWRENDLRRLARKLVPGAVAALIATATGIVLGIHEPFHVVFLFLAALALSTNLHKVVELSRSVGVGRAGGYLSHVGVGLILIGVLASSAYDHSTKVTLVQGEPQLVDGATFTFRRFIPRQGREKERMEIEVREADGKAFLTYPKLFVNDRTRQLMANPHIHKTIFQDLYLSPIEYQPGNPPGADGRVVLAKGESDRAGDVEVRFVGFDLSDHVDPRTQLAAGGQVTIGVDLLVDRGSGFQPVKAVYRFSADGRVETPPSALPGGGSIAMTGINPAEGRIQLDLGGIRSAPEPATLAIDVTRKPFINLVWWGLYVVLAGGALSTLHRLRTLRRTGEIAEADLA